ncbi:ABC transporter permease [Rugosimonospora acidiphila]|uniref:ABC transporter permease n=1 Tax=Rugosimonospora acidiphila TaxID=556531 RepID=UPI003CD05CDC
MTSDSEALTPVGGEEALVPASGKNIEGRSLGRIAFTRLKQDRVAIAGGVVVILLILVAALAPVLVKLFGHPVNDFHQDQIDPNLGGLPLGHWGGINSHFLLGVQPVSGRDMFSQILYGAQTSLLVAFFATVVAVVIGVVLGVVAGYFGGWVDSLISRVMDLFLAFPLLLFAIALISVLPNGNTVRIVILILIIGGFSWPYIGRIVRGQTLSLREREFVESARSIGARSPRILFRELLPNLAAPILVYTTLIIPTNILFEAALSFLGVGVQPPRASWGYLLSDAVSFYEFDPMYMIIPGLAIFITVLAFNLLGDGLRDALDPKSSR